MGVVLPPAHRLVALGQQFAKFATVGAGGAVVHFAVYLSLTRGFTWWREHFLLANLVAFLTSNAHNFLWHRHWTFRGRGGAWLGQYLSFLGVSSLYLVYLQGALWLMVRRFGWHDVVALVAAVSVGVAVYFTVVRRYIFRARGAG